jgi:hypothetical protein
MLFLDAPLRVAVRAVKGGRGEPFIGAQRRPLTEEAGGAGACFALEERLKFVRRSYRMEGVEFRKAHPAMKDGRVCWSSEPEEFVRRTALGESSV